MAGCLSSSVGEALAPCVTSHRVFLKKKKKKTFIDPTVGIKFSISAIFVLCASFCLVRDSYSLLLLRTARGRPHQGPADPQQEPRLPEPVFPSEPARPSRPFILGAGSEARLFGTCWQYIN